jgi:PTS system ascorbate-specific IIB component
MDHGTGRIKILVVCGMGLGSSYFVMQNVLEAIKKLKWNAQVENTDIFNAASMEADLVIGADYLVDLVEGHGRKLALNDLLDEDELLHKLMQMKEIVHG